MKKFFISFILAVCAALCTLCAPACSSQSGDDGLSVVCTIFPIYDWTRSVIGDDEDIDVTLLLDSGTDLHSYQPTAKDKITVLNCDIFIYVGGESDEWAEDILSDSKKNADMTVISLLEVLGDKALDEEEADGTPSDDGEKDEHVWLSLRNAEIFTQTICDAVCNLNGDAATSYKANAAAYISSLSALDQKYEEAVEAATQKRIVVADRFPFLYLANDYNIEYIAAYSGCSAETKASPEMITSLAQRVDKWGVSVILYESSSDIATGVKAATTSKDQQILKLDSIQSVTAADVKDGAEYLKIMESNLQVLKTALG